MAAELVEAARNFDRRKPTPGNPTQTTFGGTPMVRRISLATPRTHSARLSSTGRYTRPTERPSKNYRESHYDRYGRPPRPPEAMGAGSQRESRHPRPDCQPIFLIQWTDSHSAVVGWSFRKPSATTAVIRPTAQPADKRHIDTLFYL